MIVSIRGVLALSCRVRSSTWPTVDSTAGRIDVAHLPQVAGRLLERRQHLPEPRPDRVDRLPDLGDRVADVVPLDRAQARPAR